MAAKTPAEILDGRRPRGPDLEPAQGAVSGGRAHQARPRALLPGRRRRRAARRGRPAERARALSQRHRRRVLLSEARAGIAARRGSRSSRCSFPSGRTAEEVVPRDAAALAWMANLACLELHPHPVRADDLDHPDELRVDLDPVPGVEWAQIREVARVVRATLDDFGLVGWPKTSGSRGMHVYVRIERALDVRRGAPRRAGARARSRAARAGARHEQVVEGRAARRVPRLQPEREGSHGRGRLLGAADARRARLGAAGLGRDRRLRAARTSRWRRCRRASRRSATATPASTTHAGSLDALLELSARQEREGLGDAPWPPHYRKQAGEAAARRSRRARRMPEASADRDRTRAQRRRTRSRASSAGRRGTRRRPRTSSRPTSWSTRCAAAFSTWTRIRVNLQHVPEALRPAQEALDPDEHADDWSAVEGTRCEGSASADAWPGRAERPSRARKRVVTSS